MGISAELFWRIVAEVTLKLPGIDRQRLERTERKRGIGAGRVCDQPPVLRVAAVLSYLRLHTPQMVIAWLYGMTQTDVSRDLQRVLPALQAVLPCPQIWKIMESEQTVAADKRLA